MRSPIQRAEEIINAEREACADPDGQQLLDELLQLLKDGHGIDAAIADLYSTISDPLLSSLLYRVRNRINSSPSA